MDNTQTQLDPQAVSLAKAIRQTESGGNFTAHGKSGEYGAYQFTEPTWNATSKKYGVSVPLAQATPAQQNEVAYKQIKEWKDAGNNVGQIASMWNAGEKHKDAYLDTSYKGVNHAGAHYDVPAYAKSVASAYQTIKGGGEVGPDPNNPSSVTSNSPSNPQTFEEYLKKNPPNANSSSNDLKVSDSGSVLKDFIPGYRLAQGAGEAMAASLPGDNSSQAGLIKANNQGIDIQGQLLSQIKKDKAKGKDTSRLEKAVKDLGINIQNTGNSVSDAGTGGITSGQVAGSAGLLAALPAAAYASTALSGGGLLGTSNGLVSGFGGEGFLGSSSTTSSMLSNPVIKGILEQSIRKGETLADLSRQDAINALGNSLKEMPVTESGGATEQTILKALKELNPTLVEKQNLAMRLLKGGYNIAKNVALTSILGDKIGGFIHQNTK